MNKKFKCSPAIFKILCLILFVCCIVLGTLQIRTRNQLQSIYENTIYEINLNYRNFYHSLDEALAFYRWNRFSNVDFSYGSAMGLAVTVMNGISFLQANGFVEGKCEFTEIINTLDETIGPSRLQENSPEKYDYLKRALEWFKEQEDVFQLSHQKFLDWMSGRE